jgi:spore coat polysaccharide biosynthesis protein SpsF
VTSAPWAVVTARMTSKRLPGKVLTPLAGQPAISHVARRLEAVDGLAGVVLATSGRPADAPLRDWAHDVGIACHAGPLEDVLTRVIGAADTVGAEHVVRVTADCPMIDPMIVAHVVDRYRHERPDYASNVLSNPLTWPAGHSCEVVSLSTLRLLSRRDLTDEEREHVTLALRRRPSHLRLIPVDAPSSRERRPDLWLALDDERDLAGIAGIFDELYDRDPLFGYPAVLDLLDERPDLEFASRSRGRR